MAERIKVELARQRRDRKWLSHEAGISMSQLEKLLSGSRPFSLPSLIKIEQALQTSLTQPPSRAEALSEPVAPLGVAPDDLGAYTRASARWIMLEYVTIRPLLKGDDGIVAYRTTIYWNDDHGHLMFREDNRPDGWLCHTGDVSLPSQSGHIYLLTRAEGQFRLAILSRRAAGVLAGEQLTLVESSAGQLAPASFALVLMPIVETHQAKMHKSFGIITRNHPAYADYQRALSL